MTVVRSAVHFAASDYIDPGNLLLQNCRLSCSQLGVCEISGRQLP